MLDTLSQDGLNGGTKTYGRSAAMIEKHASIMDQMITLVTESVKL